MVSGCLGSDVDGFLFVFAYYALRTLICSAQIHFAHDPSVCSQSFSSKEEALS
jgi:hypothetical protein